MEARIPDVQDTHMAKKHRALGKTFLEEWRKASGITLETLGAEIGKSHATVSRIEKGKLPYNQEFLEAVASAYGCRPEDLLSGPPADPDNLRRSVVLKEAMRIFLALPGHRQNRMVADMIDSARLEGQPVPALVLQDQGDPTRAETH